jgi:hypothetical protein
MNFVIATWSIKQLIEIYEKGILNLNPPYQRNPVWTKKAQQELIKTIREGAPIPNFFLYETKDEQFEMVDGQQRTRAILQFFKTNEIDFTQDDKEYKNNGFLTYQIAIIIIKNVNEVGFIEEFYYRVNSSGMKLNRPESFKARFIATNFMALVQKLNDQQEFQALNIFPPASQKRMMDRDLVEELCSLLLYGITDKKLQVDKIFEKDISPEESQNVESKFKQILAIITQFNDIREIRLTRYRQRNDFYTIFNFIKDNLELQINIFKYFYQILIILDPVIKPSKFTARPLEEYAINCITQSNSSKARLARLNILNSLLLNESEVPNENQSQIEKYFGIKDHPYNSLGKYLTFNVDKLNKAIEVFIEKEEA